MRQTAERVLIGGEGINHSGNRGGNLNTTIGIVAQSSPGVKLISSKQVRSTIRHIYDPEAHTHIYIGIKYPNVPPSVCPPSHSLSPTRWVERIMVNKKQFSGGTIMEKLTILLLCLRLRLSLFIS
jgi:hypothetical protein